MLDLGCGTGVPTAGMLSETGLEVVGVDVSTEMLALARRNVPTGRFVAMDLMELDDSLGRFDGVCAFFSLLMVRREDTRGCCAGSGPCSTRAGWSRSGWSRATSTTRGCRSWARRCPSRAYPQEDLEAAIRAEGLHVLEVDVEEFEPASAEMPAERQIFLYCSAPTR